MIAIGMGLGLSIARSLVAAHGGRVRGEDNPVGGATFRFTVPISTPPSGPELVRGPSASLEPTT